MSSSTEPPAGSTKVGYVRRAHGIKGALIARVVDEELERLQPGAVLGTDVDGHPTVTIASVQPHKDGLLVFVEGVSDRNQAERLRGASLTVSAADRRTLEQDEYWPDQLLGLAVYDLSGAKLGNVSDVISGAAQDRLVVTTDTAAVEVPFVAEIVPNIDIATGSIVVDAPDGLF